MWKTAKRDTLECKNCKFWEGFGFSSEQGECGKEGGIYYQCYTAGRWGCEECVKIDTAEEEEEE